VNRWIYDNKTCLTSYKRFKLNFQYSGWHKNGTHFRVYNHVLGVGKYLLISVLSLDTNINLVHWDLVSYLRTDYSGERQTRSVGGTLFTNYTVGNEHLNSVVFKLRQSTKWWSKLDRHAGRQVVPNSQRRNRRRCAVTDVWRPEPTW